MNLNNDIIITEEIYRQENEEALLSKKLPLNMLNNKMKSNQPVAKKHLTMA